MARPADRSRGWPGRSAGPKEKECLVKRPLTVSDDLSEPAYTAMLMPISSRMCHPRAATRTTSPCSLPVSASAPARRATRSRARWPRTAGARASGTPSPRSRGASSDGSTRRGRVRPLPPRRRGRRADEGAGHGRLPLLDRLAPHPADRSRAGQREGPGVLRPAHRHAARATASSRWSRSTTGTSRRRWRTTAAGSTATPWTASPTTPRSSASGSPTASSTGSRSTSPTSPRSWATAWAPTPPARRCCSTACPPPTTCSWPTAARPSSCAGRGRRRSAAPTTTRRSGRPATTTPTSG